ncbi:Cytochrome P450, family 78, subfamily A, polypeptide 7 [Heracleum sosnowskyi]|uniref:Cytochrome P450, family 78, subfamily A, polypeptide 7 n=1 Tax=Heracleum sosnowskyi TaxID=360622 RepID=A0AAD8JHC0_9APIA|nr:Cytochrome P450, family 78, subfamily A, polypeptide 7 [Heracleum sosnowskyi]
MELTMLISKDTNWWIFTLPAFFGSKNLLDISILLSLFLAFLTLTLLTWAFSSGGLAWKNGRNKAGPIPIPGPRGLPVFGSLFTLSRGLAHRSLASLAWSYSAKAAATQLMAFSLGSTPVVVSSDPHISHQILTSPHFADRPIKQSAKSLMFSRAIGFAPNGAYWRQLRRIASSHLFSPRRISAHEPGRQSDCAAMVKNIATQQDKHGVVTLRKHLQAAALNNIMGSVFGKRYDSDDCQEVKELKEMVAEGFELLGAFNWSDYLPWLSFFYDPFRIVERCEALVPRVRKLVRGIIEEHKVGGTRIGLGDHADFVHVLLSLDGDEKLSEDDMVAVLWEMIFRGTDTTALLTEWVMAELVLNQDVQDKLNKELTNATSLSDADVAKLPYLQAVVKESLRVHPPGPLLSWARLCTSDVQLSNGMVIPANTTAMVNMWAITHDSRVWSDPLEFKPERFIGEGADVDVRGGDLTLAPFGAGRRVCPGKSLGLVTVTQWVAQLVHKFKWVQDKANPVDLSEVLKLSCEMKCPLAAVAIPRDV